MAAILTAAEASRMGVSVRLGGEWVGQTHTFDLVWLGVRPGSPRINFLFDAAFSEQVMVAAHANLKTQAPEQLA